MLHPGQGHSGSGTDPRWEYTLDGMPVHHWALSHLYTNFSGLSHWQFSLEQSMVCIKKWCCESCGTMILNLRLSVGGGLNSVTLELPPLFFFFPPSLFRGQMVQRYPCLEPWMLLVCVFALAGEVGAFFDWMKVAPAPSSVPPAMPAHPTAVPSNAAPFEMSVADEKILAEAKLIAMSPLDSCHFRVNYYCLL